MQLAMQTDISDEEFKDYQIALEYEYEMEFDTGEDDEADTL